MYRDDPSMQGESHANSLQTPRGDGHFHSTHRLRQQRAHSGAWASPPIGIRTTYRIIGSAEITLGIRHPNIGHRCLMSSGGGE